MRRPAAFYSGLFSIALATLVLEILQTRLLSVLTWYHLAFLAISLAMLGMAAGALYTYLRPRSFADEEPAGDRVLPGMARHSLLFAVSAPLAHLLLLVLRVPTEVGGDPLAVWALVAVSVTAAVPFFFAGVVVALALTRVGLPVGRIYGADLVGAGLGCLVAVPLMNEVDPTSAVFFLSALSALAALAFRAAAGPARGRIPSAPTVAIAGLAVAAFALGGFNAWRYPDFLRVEVMKGRPLPRPLAVDRWNSHSRVTGRESRPGPPTLWGEGTVPAPRATVRQMPLRIDGGAFTVATGFDGDPAELAWLRHDLTSLAFHLRGRGEVAVVGVGGGRDLLTAVAFGARRVTGVEINGIFLDLLAGDLRDFAGLAGRSDVELVHAEGRAFLSRSGRRFDLIQMALVDTWASTAAGAMTLTENGLYTVEAWRLCLRRLTPDGVLAVSRWYAPKRPGETARLLSLAVAALLAEGVEKPERHLVLVGTGSLANLLVRRTPFTAEEIRTVSEVARRDGFELLAAPGRPSADPLLAAIAGAASPSALRAAAAHPYLDLTPPTDDRPFFFNMLKAGSWLSRERLEGEVGGVLEGNLRATETLAAIFGVVTFLVLASLIAPLLVLGRPAGLAPGRFLAAAGYFSLIGLGFMLVEIALIQRFSILLGHPVRSLAVTLMSLIVATGLGSFLSDRLTLASRTRTVVVPLAMAAVVLAVAGVLSPVVGAMEGASLGARVGVVLALTVPLGLVLGLAFPVGMRLVRRRSPAVLSWMWGLNGAFGVLGTVAAVLLSMAFGISRCLAGGALCYLLLALPAAILWRDRITAAEGENR